MKCQLITSQNNKTQKCPCCENIAILSHKMNLLTSQHGVKIKRKLFKIEKALWKHRKWWEESIKKKLHKFSNMKNIQDLTD